MVSVDIRLGLCLFTESNYNLTRMQGFKMNKNQITEFRAALSEAGAEDILRWASEKFAEKIIFASALGAEDQVIIDMIHRLGLNIPVATLDTGRLFDETYQLIRETESRYGTRFQVFLPERESVENMVNKHGVNLFLDSPEKRKLCCNVRKIEPLQRALAGHQAWLCGLRREQSITRNNLSPIDWDANNKMYKINPLANWSETMVWEYIARHEVPYNRLHDRGYPSIGCAGCTRAIKRTENIRDGRWWWEKPEQKECGLHIVNGQIKRIKK